MKKVLFSFELKKFFKEKKNVFILSLIPLLLISFFIQTILEQNNLKQKDIQQTISFYQGIEQSINTLIKENLSENEKNQIDLLSNILDNLNLIIFYKENNQYIESYPYQIVLCKQLISLEKQYGTSYFKNEEILRRKNRLKILQKYKIEESFDESGTNGLLFLLTYFKYGFGILGMGLFLLAFMDLWSKEKIDGGSLLYTQPIKKKKISYTKLSTAIVIAVLLIFLIGIVIFLFGLIYSGVGSIHFPLEVLMNNKVVLIPLWQYLIKSFLLGIIGSVVFICSIKFLDALFSNSLIVSGFLILIVGISEGVSQFSPGNFTPFNLMNSCQFLSFHWEVNSYAFAIVIQLFSIACLLKISDEIEKHGK